MLLPHSDNKNARRHLRSVIASRHPTCNFLGCSGSSFLWSRKGSPADKSDPRIEFYVFENLFLDTSHAVFLEVPSCGAGRVHQLTNPTPESNSMPTRKLKFKVWCDLVFPFFRYWFFIVFLISWIILCSVSHVNIQELNFVSRES